MSNSAARWNEEGPTPKEDKSSKGQLHIPGLEWSCRLLATHDATAQVRMARVTNIIIIYRDLEDAMTTTKFVHDLAWLNDAQQ